MTGTYALASKRYSLAIAIFCIALGGIVFVGGWGFDIAVLKSLSPNLVSMKANTALSFILAGISLALYHSSAPKWISQCVATLLAIIGVVNFCETMLGWNVGIDELLFKDPLTRYGYPGRMAIMTSVNMSLLAVALFHMDTLTKDGRRIANGLSLFVIISSFIAILGYLYGVTALYAVQGYGTMALHTAIALCLMACGIVLSRPDLGLMRLLVSMDTGGVLARRLLLAVVTLPPLIGWIGLQGQNHEFYSFEYGLAVFASSNVVIFGLLAWWSAFAIQQADIERKKILDVSSWQQAILNSADLTIISTDLNGIILTCNAGALRQLGYQAKEIIGKVTPLIFHDKMEVQSYATELSRQLGQTIEPTFDMLIAKARQNVIEEKEWTYIRKDGSNLTVRLSITALHDDTGKLTGFLCISRDISDKKKALAAANASEMRFQDLFDNASDLIQSTALDGKILYVNRAWLRTLKYNEHEINEQSLRLIDILHPDSQFIFLEALQRVMNGDSQEIIEVIFIAKDKSQIIVEGTNSCQYVEGKPFATRSIFRDITQRKHHEQQIAKQQQQIHEAYRRNQAILDYANYSIIGADLNGTITTFNKGAEALLGYSASEVVGKATPAIIHLPEEVVARANALSKELNIPLEPGFEVFVAKARLGFADENEWTYVRKDGSHVPVLLTVTAQYDQGLIVGFMGIANNITERKRIDKMKSEFVSTVSHELRTPLTSIRGALGLVLGKASSGMSDKARMLLETASRNCDRLTLLINDILDLEKIESGTLVFNMTPVDLIAIAKQSLMSNESYAQQHNVSLVMNSRLAQAPIMADEHRLLQVFANLLSNAVKYSSENGVVDITITATAKHFFRVAIKDHGAGIPEAFREQLFQRFAQADSSDTRAKGGTGLGLSITKAIIERHNGQIDYTTEEGVGTEFYFQLPEWVETTETAITNPRQPKLLICEDNPDFAHILSEMLSQQGIASDIAATALAAQQLLGKYNYRALLLDLILPDMDGLHLIRELHDRAESHNLPIIVISGRAQENRAFLDEAENVVDWLQKPIVREQLIYSLKVALHLEKMPRILHVEDDTDFTQVTRVLLEEIADYTTAHTLAEARALLAQCQYDIVLLDLSLPDGSGLELLEAINQQQAQVIIFSGQEPDLIKQGHVSAVLTKSKTSDEQLLTTIKKIIDHANGEQK